MPTDPYSNRIGNLSTKIDAPFVGRRDDLSSIYDFLDIGKWSSSSGQAFVYHLWGQGGYGKSMLLQFARRSSRLQEHNLKSVAVNLDWDIFHPGITAPDFLWHIRCALVKQGIKATLYDFYYLLYFSSVRSPGQNLVIQSLLEDIAAKSKSLGESLQDGSETGWLEALFDSEMVKGVIDLAGGIGKQLKVIETLNKLNQLRVDRVARLKLKEGDYVLDPNNSSAFQKIAADILALDIVTAVSGQDSPPFVIFIDGLDRIQPSSLSPGSSSQSERALECIVASIIFQPNESIKSKVRFVFSGRNPLRWREQFDDVNTELSWNAFIAQHRLAGLSPIDVGAFIDKLNIALDSCGQVELGLKLRQHKERLLELLHDRNGSDDLAHIFPARLGLLYEYVTSGADLDRLVQLDISTQEMEERYFRSIDPNLRRVLEIFSVMGTIEEPIYASLVRSQNIVGYDINEFLRFRRLPYVSEGEYLGSIKLDEHISSYLIRALMSSADEMKRAKKMAIACLTAIVESGNATSGPHSAMDQKSIAIRFSNLLARLTSQSLLSFQEVIDPWWGFESSFGSDTRIAGALRVDICRTLVKLINEIDKSEFAASLETNPTYDARNKFGFALIQIHKFFVVHKLSSEADNVVKLMTGLGIVTTVKKNDELTKALPLEFYEFNIDKIYGSSNELGVAVAAGQLLQIWKEITSHPDSRERTMLLATTARYLGELFRNPTDVEESLKWMQKHYDLSKSINAVDSPEFAKSQMALALALINTRRQDKPERLLQQALKTLLPLFGPNHLHVINAQWLLAEIVIARGNRKDGIAQMRDCLTRLRDSDGDNESYLSTFETRIAFLESSSSIVYTPFGSTNWMRRR